MSSRLIAIAGCVFAFAASSAWAQSQPAGTAGAGGAKAPKATTTAPARQAVTTATGNAKPAAAQQSKAPESAAKADDAWKSGCHHGKDSDA